MAALYDALSQVAPSPVVEVNRAVALGMAFGPDVGLELADQLLDVPVLARYHLLYGVRAICSPSSAAITKPRSRSAAPRS